MRSENLVDENIEKLAKLFPNCITEAKDENGNLAPKTLQELAKELGVSAERVRQIEKNALIKMRKALTAPADEYV